MLKMEVEGKHSKVSCLTELRSKVARVHRRINPTGLSCKWLEHFLKKGEI